MKQGCYNQKFPYGIAGVVFIGQPINSTTYEFTISETAFRINTICDWACENRAYLHKLHMFRKWYFSWFVLKIFMFCNFYLIAY